MFRNLGTGIFWYWNATPTPGGIRKQLKQIAEAGFTSVYLHPMPDSFHKPIFFQGMECGYLGKLYFQLAHVMLDECKKLGLVMMLYDEGGWPSGGVLDRLVKIHPECKSRFLIRQPDGTYQEVLRDIPDLLKPETSKIFLAMVHERYKEEFGAEFGHTIRGIFTDEPFFRCAPGKQEVRIADGMRELAKSRFNCDFDTDILPYLFEGTGKRPGATAARRKYLAICSHLFTAGYSEVLSDWCKKNHLDLEGHFDREDVFFELGDCGDLLQHLTPLQVPGVDAIWRQIFPGTGMGHYARFASSAAIRGKRKEALCECFNVYGYGLTTSQMNWIANALFIQGINRILPMPFLYSDRGMRKICCSTDISPRIPQWHFFTSLTGIWNKTSQFNTGALAPKVWVLARTEFPTPDQPWTPKQKNKNSVKRVEKLLDRLDESGIFWRFANQEDLYGEEVPQVLILPSQPDDWENKGILRLQEKGVKVFSGWNSSLREFAEVQIVGGRSVCRILPCRRPEGDSLMIFNPSSENTVFRFKTSENWTEINLDSTVEALFPITRKRGVCSVPIPPGNLRILVRGKQPRIAPRYAQKKIKLNWQVVKEERLNMSAEGTTCYKTKKLNVPLAPDGMWDVPEFSGIITLNARQEFEQPVKGYLCFDEICHAGELLVNGKSVGKRAFAPWAFPVEFRKGMNRISLKVFSGAGNEWKRCSREELKPRQWFNSYFSRLEKYSEDDLLTGVSPSVTLFLEKHGKKAV